MSNLIIRETKFIEYAENEEIIEEEEEEIIEEKLVDAKSGRSKRTRSNKVSQTKKVVRQTKKILQPTPKEKSTSSLMYLLTETEGIIKLNTEFEYTTFKLDLPSKHLAAILDDFHLRFKDLPTFSDYLIMETIKLLKHDYFVKIKENSMMKLKMLLCHLVEDEKLKNYPSNPLLEVADIAELRDKLMSFYRTFYQPTRMKLILKSNMAIDKMERLLNDSFGRLVMGDPRDCTVPGDDKADAGKRSNLKLFTEKENQNLFYVRPHSKKQGIEDFLPIRQNLMVDLDEFEEHSRQLDEKLVEENGLGKTISNKISHDNNHLIFSYTSQKQNQCKNDEQITDQLCFIFNLPYDKGTHFPIMPMHFISSLICKDGPGTLASHLRKHDLIAKMQAGNLNDCNFANNRLWSLFFIKMHLTKRGIGNLNEIVKCLNAYLAMLTKLEAKLEPLYEEHSKLACFDYNFKEVRSKSAHDLFVTVKKMHLYPTKDIFIANRLPLYPKLNKHSKVVRSLLRFLKLDACVIAVLANESSFNSIDSNYETYRGIDVKKLPIDQRLFQAIDLFSVDQFPKTNRFLQGSGNHNQVKLESKVYYVPEPINKNEQKQLWYKKECTELLSLTNVNLLISNEEFKKNAKYAAICDLLLVISEIQMQELFFEIREAGFLYRVEFNRFGLNITATGSDAIINVFKQVLDKFKSVAAEDRLKKAKRIALKSYENALKNKFMVFLDLQNCLLFRNHYTIQQRMAELEKVTLKDLNRMIDLIFNQSKRVYLVQGNYTLNDAKKFFTVIEQMFECQTDLLPANHMNNYNKRDDTKALLMETDCSISTDNSDGSSSSAESLTFDETDRTNQATNAGSTRQSVNQTYNVKAGGGAGGVQKAPKKIKPPKTNEIFPIGEVECYSSVKLVVDSPALILNEKAVNISDLSLSSPDSSFMLHQVRPEGQRHIESTSLKPAPNRRLFMDTNNCPSFNASRIGAIAPSFSRSRKNSSMLSSICTDVTNTNYNLSPLNGTQDTADYSRLIGKDSQIVGNLYFTHYRNARQSPEEDDVQHSLLLRLLVELIKQHMNGFFTNEQNLRDRFFTAEEFKNSGTPEITFQDQVLIDGQIECVDFELAGDSKGFLFIVFDNYLLISSKSIDSLAESFLSKYMFKIVDKLNSNEFAGLAKQLADDLAKRPSWTQDMHRNWSEIVIGKKRFDLREKQKAALESKVRVAVLEEHTIG